MQTLKKKAIGVCCVVQAFSPPPQFLGYVTLKSVQICELLRNQYRARDCRKKCEIIATGEFYVFLIVAIIARKVITAR